MARVKRAWSVLKAEVYGVLRESAVDGESYWSHADMLRFWNHSLDLRLMELGLQQEGWFAITTELNVAAGIKTYGIPTFGDRVLRVLWIVTDGSSRIEIPLMRSENPFETVVHGGILNGLGGGTLPTYRLEGTSIILEPWPQQSTVNGSPVLGIHYEALPDHFVNDASELPATLPLMLETLLVYDTAMLALQSEGAQGAVDPSIQVEVGDFRAQFAARFAAYTESRSYGPVFSTPYYLGD